MAAQTDQKIMGTKGIKKEIEGLQKRLREGDKKLKDLSNQIQRLSGRPLGRKAQGKN